MASRIRKMYVDTFNRKAYSGFTSKITLAIVDFFVADDEILQIISMQPNPDDTSTLLYINQPIVGNLFVALGIPDSVANGGAFNLTDPIVPQTGSNIPFNITAANLQALIRTNLSTTYPNCIVTQNGPCDYTMDRVDVGVLANPITGDGTDLFPSSVVNVLLERAGSTTASQVVRIVLNQQPAAFTSSGWTPLPVAAVTVTSLITGSTGTPAVHRVSINPDAYQGGFYLTATTLGAGNATTGTSAQIPFDATIDDMRSAIIAGFGAGNEVTVTYVNGFTWDVAFTGANVTGKPMTQMTGNASTLSVPVGLQGTFDLRNNAASSLLGESTSVGVYFQIKNDDGTNPQTWFFGTCTLNASLISPGVLGASTVPFPITEADADVRFIRIAPVNGSFRQKTEIDGTVNLQFYNATTGLWHTLFPTGPSGSIVTDWGDGEA